MKKKSIAMILCLMMVFSCGVTAAYAAENPDNLTNHSRIKRSLDDGYYENHDCKLLLYCTSSDAQNLVYATDEGVDVVAKAGKYGAGVLSAAELAIYKDIKQVLGGAGVYLATCAVELGWSMTKYNIMKTARKFDYVKIYRPNNSNALIVVGTNTPVN